MTDASETLERAALEDLIAAAPDALRESLGIRGEALGAGFMAIAGALPASAIVANRTIGLGLGRPESREVVEALVERYGTAGVARYFVHVHPDAQPDELGDWLGDQGLEQTRGWVKFERGRSAPPETRTTLDIRAAGDGDRAAFGRIVAAAFDLGSQAAPWLSCLIGRPGWHVFMSFEGAQPAGCGSLFVQGDLGWLDWGATDPAFRGRGSQSTLLARRIAHALDLGCRRLFTETGEEVPSDPQHSYSNIERMGFTPAYVRKNFAPPKIG